MHLDRQQPLSSSNEPADSDYGQLLRADLNTKWQRLAVGLQQVQYPMLLGIMRADYSQGEYRLFNASALFTPGLKIAGFYDKIHLVPFGEYIPLVDWFWLIDWLLPYEAGVTFVPLDSAEQGQTIRYEKLNFAPLICFEDTLPSLARQVVANRNPDFFVNQSNDGWFVGTWEPWYHLAASLFRTVENRRPMVRSANTGISVLIDGNGRISHMFEKEAGGRLRPVDVEGYFQVTVPLDSRTSLYTRWGDWLPVLCWLVIGGFLMASIAWHLLQAVRRVSPRGAMSDG